MTKTLNENERNILVNALHVAAGRFQEHVASLAAECRPPLTHAATKTLARLREQFDRQATEAFALAQRIEDADEITLATHVKCRTGRCPTCGHYGDDCTGTEPADVGLVGRRVKALKPDMDDDENGQLRQIPVGSMGRVLRVNHVDRDGTRHYDIAWDNGAWTIYDEAEIGTDLEVQP